MTELLEPDTNGRPSEVTAEERSQPVDRLPESRPRRQPSGIRRHLTTAAASALLIVAVIGVLVAIAWIKYVQIQTAMSQPPPPEMPVSVNVIDVMAAKVSPETTVVGTVLAPRMVMLRNEEPGTVTEVLMQPGGLVKAGDPLVKMDIRVEQAEIDAATATLTQAKSTLRRAEKLQRSSALSGEELDAANASVARAAAEVERLRAIVDRKQLRAPFDARAGLFQLHVGQYLDVGTEIVTLEGTDNFLLVDFAVPAHVADTLRVGSEVHMRVARDSERLSATIDAMDSRADAESRLMQMRAKLKLPPKALVPGDSILVTVPYGVPTPVALVPQTAVRRGPSGETVFVARASQSDGSLRATSVSIVTAGNDGKKAYVVSGLSPGDQVVADGSFKVFEGCLLQAVSP